MEFWKDNHNIEFQEFIDSPNLSSASREGSDSELDRVVQPVINKQDYSSGSNSDLIPNGQVTNDVDIKPIKQFLPQSFAKTLIKIHSIKTSNEKGQSENFHENEMVHSSEEETQTAIQNLGTLKKIGLSVDLPPSQDASFTSDVSFLTVNQVPSGSPASTSFISEEDILFKKREIKCKNIRRSEISIKRSVSPEKREGRQDKSEERHAEEKAKKDKYPKDWLEYKEMKLNTKRHALLKSKVLKGSEVRKFDFKRYFNFDKPPLQAEHHRYQNTKGNFEMLPFQYLRYTAAKPQLIYSTNHMQTSPTPLNREQIFAIIPKERKLIIEKLWKYSRVEPLSEPKTVRAWFPKKWKSLGTSEAKLLENSVGLSFLQGYSDDEETHTEEPPLTVADIAEEPQPLLENTPDNLEGILTLKSKTIWEPCDQPFTANIKSRWDSAQDGNHQSEDINTPPLVKPEQNDKEEGEVSENEYTPQTPELPKEPPEEVVKEVTLPSDDIDVEEYERTKKELLKLEEVLKSSKSYLEELQAEESEKPADKKKQKKKKRKKLAVVKVSKAKDSKKKLKKRKKKKDDFVNSETGTEEETSKKKKRKKPEKHKVVKSKPKKKRKNSKSDSDSKEKRKKKKKQTTEKSRRRTISYDSDLKEHKPEEDYEDDIKFFAERLIAERELKGKSKHKTKGIHISLDELTVPKTEEKASKRKLSESDEVRSKSKDNESKKEEVKVDLLKMNEEYLREQKKKEEYTPKRKTRDSRSLSLENCKIKSKPDKEHISEALHKPDECIEPAKIVEEVQPDWARLKEKRKRTRVDSNNQETTEKKAKEVEELLDIVFPEQIKQEKLLSQKSNSWEESDEDQIELEQGSSPNLEIPLHIQHVPRKEIKIEKDVFDIEEPPGKANADEKTVNREEQPDLRLHLLEIKSRKSEAIGLDVNALTPTKKKRRWDIQVSPVILPESSKDIVTLEDEYEEFIKAVAVKNEEETNNAKVVVADSNSDSSLTLLEESPASKPVKDVASVVLDGDKIEVMFEPKPEAEPALKSEKIQLVPISPSTLKSQEVGLVSGQNSYTDQATLGPVPSPKADTLVEITTVPEVLPIISPLKSVPVAFKPIPIPSPKVEPPPPPPPPLKTDEFKPAPVPSPKLEAVLELNKPLINLSLSANVTQNITFSLATSMPSISAPITSTIDVSKPKVEISTLPTETYYFTPEIFQLPPPPPPPPEEPNAKVTFTSLALPSKKLLDNSQLNLDDSDGDDTKLLEEEKRKRLEALIEDNQRETHKEKARMDAIINKLQEISRDGTRRSSPPRRASTSTRRRDPSPKRGKKGRRESPARRRGGSSPRRRSPAVRNRSPRRSSPRRRSPVRRRRRSSARRSVSPKRRRSTSSPRKRRSPSPKRKRSQSPKKSKQRPEVPDKVKHEVAKNPRDLSPLQRNLPDSTISDDQLSRLSFPGHEFLSNQPPKSPKRVSLDVRISQVLGQHNEPRHQCSPKPISTITTSFYHNNENFHQGGPSSAESPSKRNIPPTLRTVENQGMYRQVGNIMQIVPIDQENINEIPIPSCSGKNEGFREQYQNFDNLKSQFSHTQDPRPQIVQVGNVLEVVPTEITGPSLLQQIKTEITDETWNEQQVSQEKPSAEASMLQKEAERREQREKRRLEREKRRVEKEKRRQEKEKIKQARTEDLIRKALEEEEEENERADLLKSDIVQWPPLPLMPHNAVNKEVRKSILMNRGNRFNEISPIEDKVRKVVQFADGVKPGYGTSPSAGEELSSPPPPKRKLPKEKRYKKLKFNKKSLKKKKVKVLKKSLEESDSDDNLPPPSPPPGSPPPHIFPPRVKHNVINNVPTAYLASIMQTVQQLQTPSPSQLNMYRTQPPPVNLLMPPPPLSHVQSPNVPPPHLPPPPHVPTSHHQSPHGTPLHTAQSPQGPYPHHMGLPPIPSPGLQGSTVKTSRWSSDNTKW
ncbi:titin-like isoform X2 [Anthonomus grandis grandis]|uniref:titin-like isoform X2 n=1 Tax=Anthonomus grandis grandis TaxID=2921223 RepID=UPI0021662882|nr:titin-like isoform X2 [Anthonomus grandis grandis]